MEGFAVEDLVVVNPGLPCGECRYCQSGRDNLCERILGIGYQQPGGYAEYLCAPASRAVKMAPEAPMVGIGELMAVSQERMPAPTPVRK